MDKIYLEFLEELAYSLEEYENSYWSNWMHKSSLLFQQNADLNYFFGAFGGMGSFNDNFFSSITTELKTITYLIATSLRNNKPDSILSIIDEEQKRCAYNCSLEQAIEFDNQCLNYVNYLVNNYNLGNLHVITEKYRNDKDINDLKDKAVKRR